MLSCCNITISAALPPPVTSTTPDAFIAHLDWLEANDFSIVPLQELVDTLRDGDSFASTRVAAITFDDAGESVCTVAWPELKRRQLPFTLFINTEAVEQQFAKTCSWQQLQTMAESPLMTPANHTHTHGHQLDGYLADEGVWRERVSNDIDQAQQLIEQRLGRSSQLFAYPFGEYNQALAEIVSDKGYIGFGQHSGAIGPQSDFSALPRFAAGSRYANLDTLAPKLMSLPLPARFSSSHSNPLLVDSKANPPQLTIKSQGNSLQGMACYNQTGETLPLTQHEAGHFTLQAEAALSPGRHRYTCTAPSGTSGRFHWLSHQWLVVAAP